MKTKSVHIYVQRESTFRTPSAVIPFEVARLNEGNAFNLSSGTFTVPVPGIYHFQFSASANYLEIHLRVNDVRVGLAFTNSKIASLSASFRLKAGDRVDLLNGAYGVLFDNLAHRTHFSGWLVEEDLM